MDKTERARLLDTLRKRRSRKRERALSEGKPEDFYLTEEDFIDFYERTEQDAAPAPGRVGTPSASARTSVPRQSIAPVPAEEEPDEQDAQASGSGWGEIIGACLLVGGVLLGIWQGLRGNEQ